MTFTKEQLLKEAANTLMEIGNNGFFDLVSATLTIQEFLARLGIDKYDMIDMMEELLRRQQEEANGVE